MIYNKNFQNTNMVYSMFLASKFINQDVVICYGDIIFNPNVYNLITKKGNIIPLNVNWLKIWKKRMMNKDIKTDAENISILFKKIDNSKIDMTSFLNISILKKKINFKIKKYKSYWYEIDNKKDLEVSSRELKK